MYIIYIRYTYACNCMHTQLRQGQIKLPFVLVFQELWIWRIEFDVRLGHAAAAGGGVAGEPTPLGFPTRKLIDALHRVKLMASTCGKRFQNKSSCIEFFKGRNIGTYSSIDLHVFVYACVNNMCVCVCVHIYMGNMHR